MKIGTFYSHFFTSQGVFFVPEKQPPCGDILDFFSRKLVGSIGSTLVTVLPRIVWYALPGSLFGTQQLEGAISRLQPFDLPGWSYLGNVPRLGLITRGVDVKTSAR